MNDIIIHNLKTLEAEIKDSMDPLSAILPEDPSYLNVIPRDILNYVKEYLIPRVYYVITSCPSYVWVEGPYNLEQYLDLNEDHEEKEFQEAMEEGSCQGLGWSLVKVENEDRIYIVDGHNFEGAYHVSGPYALGWRRDLSQEFEKAIRDGCYVDLGYSLVAMQ